MRVGAVALVGRRHGNWHRCSGRLLTKGKGAQGKRQDEEDAGMRHIGQTLLSRFEVTSPYKQSVPATRAILFDDPSSPAAPPNPSGGWPTSDD